MIYDLMIYDLMIYDLMIYLKTRRQGCWGSVFKHLSTHEIAVEHVETPRGELSAESIDNRLCAEVVQHSACASLGTKAKQKTLSAKVGSKKTTAHRPSPEHLHLNDHRRRRFLTSGSRNFPDSYLARQSSAGCMDVSSVPTVEGSMPEDG